MFSKIPVHGHRVSSGPTVKSPQQINPHKLSSTFTGPSLGPCRNPRCQSRVLELLRDEEHSFILFLLCNLLWGTSCNLNLIRIVMVFYHNNSYEKKRLHDSQRHRPHAIKRKYHLSKPVSRIWGIILES